MDSWPPFAGVAFAGGATQCLIARALPSRRGPNNLPDLISHAWRGSSSSGAGAERPPHTTVPPPWDARFRVDVEGLTVAVAVAAARHYSRRSGVRVPRDMYWRVGKLHLSRDQVGGHRKTRSLRPPAGPRTKHNPFLGFFPTFELAVHPPLSSLVLSPRPSSRHRSPSSLPSPLPPCNPASSRLSPSL